MTRNLRRAHLGVQIVLAVLVPLLFLAALFARRPTLEPVATPAELPGGEVIVHAGDLWRGGPVLDTRLYRLPTGRFVLLLDPAAELAVPDPLVYWKAGPALEDTDALPGDAFFVGVIAGADLQRFELPGYTPAGTLFLYSLAHRRMVAVARLEGAGP